MLRYFVLVLLLLNGLYYAWSHELLRELGLAPVSQSEPQRLNSQIKPELLHLVTAQELRLEEAAARLPAKPAVCLQTGLFDADQSALLRRALEAGWPADSWALTEAGEAARWIVYMGKFANPEALAKKRSELGNLHLKFEPLLNPALELGLSLGGFETQAAANAALETLGRRGVRTARVLLERAELRGQVLKLPAVDDALRSRLEEIKPLLVGKALSPCR